MSTRARRRPQVAVVGGGQATPAVLGLAEAVGALLACRGAVLITGGRGGVMAAASRGARAAGGLTIGILPGGDAAEANEWCEVALPTGLGNARNALVAQAGDCVVAIGGEAGTLSEVALALTYRRPVLVLAGADGWVERATHAQLLPAREVVLCADLAALEAELARLFAAVQP